MNLKSNYKNSICKVLIVLTLTIFVLIGNIGTFGTYVLANNTNSGPDINAKSALLIDNKTNKVLYSKDMNRKMFPASTTKILTAILVLENHSLDEKVTASYNAIMTIPSGYSTANIQIDEVLTVEQLLELLLVHSANDAANVLAEYTGGSIDSFVAMMNTKINELGLSDTHFTNPYGLQDNNHYTTAHDLARRKN
jgi:serine-type D-Ala-D-Ala carboxypeptidase (penicillin-binding protein 5/6)